MRMILMGNGPFAVPSFERIASYSHEILAVVARPAVASSGKGPPESPVVTWARERSLALHTPASINDPETIVWLTSLKPDLLVVCDYGQILKPEALGTARLGGINLHGSLLPRHRGAAPVQWSILAGDSQAGVSVIHMTPALDAGPILTRAATAIDLHEDAGMLEARLSQLGVEPTLQAIAMLETNDHPSGEIQDRTYATRAPRLKKSDGELHWKYPVRWIDRQIRGLQPWPGAFTHLELPNGKELRLIVHHAIPLELKDVSGLGNPGDVISGQALESLNPTSASHGLAVLASDGAIVLDSVQPAGKKAMSGEAFLRGYAKETTLLFRVPTQPNPLLEAMMAMPNESARSM
jgi:methionyl-tRNA formyltransferase